MEKLINNPNNYIFFLGGYDAEIATIKEILEEKKAEFYDKKLSWGAKLSEYNEELNKLPTGKIPVFIELELDIAYPSYAVIIDHHNESAGADKKTSIEQISDRLDIKLNRKQQLISANDKDLFKGMQNLEATEEEIKRVNEYENKAQKITAKDYKLAENSIRHFGHVIEDDIIIIDALIPKARPILEKLYDFNTKSFKYNHIFIRYRDKEINYTGSGDVINTLIKKYKLAKENDLDIIYWWGGYLPCRGYFGSNKVLSNEEIKDLVKRPIQSQHIFIFPFVVESNNNKKIDSHENIFIKIFNDLRKQDSSWQEIPFNFENKKIDEDNTDKNPTYVEKETWKYNEYNYFYKFVKKTLFTDELTKDPISYYFEKKIYPKAEFIISIKDDCKINEFHLFIDNISLRIFENGIGVLALTLYNYLYTDLKNILIINDFGRRIYPQFLGRKGTIDTQNAFLSYKLTLINGKEIIEENFDSERFFKKTDSPLCAEYIYKLLYPIKEFQPIIDDRMYTLCWYGNKKFISDLQQYDDKLQGFNYESNIDWYRFIFIDGKYAGIANLHMTRDLIKRTTYARFLSWGTLYGISRYSFVCLTDRGDMGYSIIRNHMERMYYQIAVLVLAQRASIVKFNQDITEISKELDISKDNNSDFVQRIENLSKDIIKFSNRLWHDEITAQEQGIEIYNLAQINMCIREQLKSLRERANELFTYLELIKQEESNNRIITLTSLGALFLPLTLWAAIFNLSKLPEGIIPDFTLIPLDWKWINPILLFLSLPITIFYSFRLLSINKMSTWKLILPFKKRSSKITYGILFLIFLLAILVILI